MRLIKPRQISGEIMTLIEEAEKKIILICPYYKISKWYKLTNIFKETKRRNIDIEFYVRENEVDSIQEIKSIGFNPICIPNLHTKLYLNENYGIVSSMNLLLSSENSSLEIAMKTENQKEYLELEEYYLRYLKKYNNHSLTSTNILESDWKKLLSNKLLISFGIKIQIIESEQKYQIKTQNHYEVFIWNTYVNKLRISCILSNHEFLYAKNNPQIFQSSKMKIDLRKSSHDNRHLIWGTYSEFKSSDIKQIEKFEVETIVEVIFKYISGIEEFKNMLR